MQQDNPRRTKEIVETPHGVTRSTGTGNDNNECTAARKMESALGYNEEDHNRLNPDGKYLALYRCLREILRNLTEGEVKWELSKTGHQQTTGHLNREKQFSHLQKGR
jgi:hypothetical protein